ncbi:MAG: hypothetical protein U1A77_11225 [Pirellulales bacterium]
MDLLGLNVVAIGYPGRERNRSRKAVLLERKVFKNVFGVKRLAPGAIDGRERIESFEHIVPEDWEPYLTLIAVIEEMMLRLATLDW